ARIRRRTRGRGGGSCRRGGTRGASPLAPPPAPSRRRGPTGRFGARPDRAHGKAAVGCCQAAGPSGRLSTRPGRIELRQTSFSDLYWKVTTRLTYWGPLHTGIVDSDRRVGPRRRVPFVGPRTSRVRRNAGPFPSGFSVRSTPHHERPTHHSRAGDRRRVRP